MTRHQVIRTLHRIATIRKEASSKQKEATRLQKEADAALDLVESLRGVRIHNKFPLRTVEYNGGYEVTSACDESRRSAFVSRQDDLWCVVGYRNEGPDEDTVSLGTHAKAKAMATARNYVILGAKQ